MKKLLFFFGSVLCGLVTNAQIPGIESYSSQSFLTRLNSYYDVPIYDDGTSIIIELDSLIFCESVIPSQFNADSMWLNISFIDSGNYSIDIQEPHYLWTHENGDSVIAQIPMDLALDSFNIINNTTGKVYPIKLILGYEKHTTLGGNVYDESSGLTQPLANALVKTDTDLVTITDSEGYFEFSVPPLEYVKEITISSTDYFASVINISPEKTKCVGGTQYYTKAFLFENNDLSILLNSIQNRPGFTMPYYVSIQNRGKNPLTTKVAITLDGNLTYTSQTGENKPATASGQTLTWDNITVESGATKRLTFYATLDRLTSLGTELVSTAELIMATPDDVPENDTTTFKTIVSGSFDPNDKLVTYAGAFTEGYVYDTTSFEYTIRFQNTGTDTAFTVRLEDVISKNLDLTTINFIDASHEPVVSISGDTVKWLFENILLPDSNINEPASHGFVRFSIQQKVGNQAGTVIKNKAAIYFDFNDPVITNEIISIVDNDIVTELENDIHYQTQGIISAYPNPANTVVSINAEGTGSFKLYNAIGSPVLKTFNKENINIESLKSGVYYYQFITNAKTYSGSFVKE